MASRPSRKMERMEDRRAPTRAASARIALQAGRRLRPAHEQIERELGASERRLAVPSKQAIDLSDLPDLLN